jgi:PAS domain S-box-containing protein
MQTNAEGNTMLRVLCLEDSPQDVEIIRELLVDAGYDLNMDCTAVEKEFASLLRSCTYDIILSDFKLPGFDAFAALRWTMEICPNVPFICVSGSIGEESAVELLRMGAVDYILKDRLERLPFAIQRALDAAKEKESRRRAEEALSTSEERYRRLFETAQDGILLLDAESGAITDANPFIMEMLGYALEDLIGKQLWEVGAFIDRAASKSAFEELQQKKYIRYENLPLETKDGRSRQVEFVSNVYRVNGKKIIQCNVRDITNRKWLEEDKQKLLNKLQESLAHIKELNGLLPICSNCKKIRDDKGFWNQVEKYIGEHTDAEFTHGICPECAKKQYGDLYDRVIEKQNKNST